LILPALFSVVFAAHWEPVEVVATAYCPCVICCGRRAAGITANNTKVKDVPYGIASDPDRIPYGTTIWIPAGYGYLDNARQGDEARQFTMDDTGGALRRETKELGVLRIDLRFIQHRNAKRFGRKLITIYIWKD
jgi:3D (Asp-Asp-Asp) domain-containing protein